MKITWIGHATSLIEIGSNRFLTDPNFSDLILFFIQDVIIFFYDISAVEA